MPTATATKTMEKPETSFLPVFTIEVDHPRNCDLLIQAIPNCRLRSAIKASRTTIVNNQSEDNEPVIPKDQARHLGSLPLIPGMRLKVDTQKLAYEIIDPLHEDKKLCDKIKSAMMSDGRPYFTNGVKGVPPQKGTLDKHRMKTLCREVINLLNAEHVVMKKGMAPDIEDVNELPGHFLLNPGSRVPNNQPRFEKDLDDYKETIQNAGG